MYNHDPLAALRLSAGLLWRASGGGELDLGVADQHSPGAPHRLSGAAAEADVRESTRAAGAEHQSAACQVTLRLRACASLGQQHACPSGTSALST